jgi:hypothetical protein
MKISKIIYVCIMCICITSMISVRLNSKLHSKKLELGNKLLQDYQILSTRMTHLHKGK